MPEFLQFAQAARSIPDLFVQVIERWADRRFRDFPYVVTHTLENFEVNGSPGLLLTEFNPSGEDGSWAFFLPDYSTGQQVYAADVIRQLGPAMSFWFNGRRDFPFLPTAPQLGTIFIGTLAAGFIVFLQSIIFGTVTPLDTENKAVYPPQHQQALVTIKVSGDTCLAAWSMSMDVQLWSALDDPRIQTWQGLTGINNGATGAATSTGVDIAQSLSDIAHTRMDFQMNNGGPSWSLTGGARIDGAGGG